MKRRVFEVLNVVQPEDRVAQTIDVLLTLLIVLNVLALILGTMDDVFRTAPQAFRPFRDSFGDRVHHGICGKGLVVHRRPALFRSAAHG